MFLISIVLIIIVVAPTQRSVQSANVGSRVCSVYHDPVLPDWRSPTDLSKKSILALFKNTIKGQSKYISTSFPFAHSSPLILSVFTHHISRSILVVMVQ